MKSQMWFSKTEKCLAINKEEQESSKSDDEDLEELSTKEEQHGPSGKVLTFKHKDSFQLSRDMIIQESDTPVYYANVSEFTRHKPDITLHRGGKDGTVVAASFFGFGKFRLGIGSDDISMVWTELKRGGALLSKRYEFDWNGSSYVLQRAKSKRWRYTQMHGRKHATEGRAHGVRCGKIGEAK